MSTDPVADFLYNLAVNLAANLLSDTASTGLQKLRRIVRGSSLDQAFQQVYAQAFQALGQELAAHLQVDDLHHVDTLLREFVADAEAHALLLRLAFDDQDVPLTALHRRFIALGGDPGSLGWDLDKALVSFVTKLADALYQAAATEGSPLFPLVSVNQGISLRRQLANLPNAVATAVTQRLQTEQLTTQRTRWSSLIGDHRSFIQDRLARFVGRAQELEVVQQLIEQLTPTGGYLTITGQPGQGKSSLIARIVQDADLARTLHHFIPLTPGPDYQVVLLRALLAQIIRKHILAELYEPSENRAVLRDLFFKALQAIADSGQHEVVYIDGLDQLEEDPSGIRDLSFLPVNPPPGVVIVLSTRPNDTLRPLELRQPNHEYPLPNLSRADFDLILQAHNVSLAQDLADRFYSVMEQNALYLDLVAQELAETGAIAPDALIEQIASNPDNLFSVAIDRFKRQRTIWQEITRPLLGALLVAQEPLSIPHLRQLIGQTHEAVRDELRRLGGLVSTDSQGRYTLFHLKFREYLRQDLHRSDQEFVFAVDEVAEWHQHLAEWCLRIRQAPDQQAPLSSEAEAQLAYAQAHGITHVFHAAAWDQLRTLITTSPHLSYTLDYYRKLRELTAVDAAQGEQLIFDHLLPYLENDNGAPSTNYDIHCYRDELVAWIEQYPPALRGPLRNRVIDYLLGRLQGPHPQSACWTITCIGYRRQDIVDRLWALADQHDDKTGDTALAALSTLGVLGDNRPRLLTAIHERMARRRTLPLYSALRRVPDASSIAPIITCWLDPASDNEVDELTPDWVFSVLADLADAYGADPDISNRIWQSIADRFEHDFDAFWGAVYGSNLASYCDNPQVVPDLLRWLAKEGTATDKPAHLRSLLYHRLDECIRPRHLESWIRTDNPAALAFIQTDACRDTEHALFIQTSEAKTKELAWIQALRWGQAAALTWFEPGVTAETSPFVQAHLYSLLACFRLDPLPPLAIERVTRRRALHTQADDMEVAACSGALRLVRSAASREAFDALRQFGFTLNGQVLQEVVTALSEVAATLIRAGDTTIIPTLLAAITGEAEAWQRQAAAGALQELAAEKLVSAEHAVQLIPLLLDEGLDAFTRSVFVSILDTSIPDGLPDAIRPHLVQWAAEQTDWLGIRALAALANHGYLINEPALLRERLGLEREGDTWIKRTGFRRGEWDTWVMGLLYAHDPAPFIPVIAAIVRGKFWPDAARVIRILQALHGHADQAPLPPEIAAALLERARTRQSPDYTERDLFAVLARLAPDALVTYAWEPLWADWHTNARAALADALGTARYTDPTAPVAAIADLYALTGDSQYSVRRAAYRGLARRAAASLQSLCHDWAAAEDRALRQRAAEAWAWLPTDLPLADTLYQALVVDLERSVREAVERAWQERRKRRWAAQYLEQVLAVTGGADTPAANVEMLQAWRYGHALIHTGDDTTIDSLQEQLAVGNLPPHVRHWLRQILKNTQKNWEKVTKKWPDPAPPWQGTIEEGAGVVRLPDGTEVPVRYSLWHEPAETPAEKTAWGGTFWVAEDHRLGLEEVTLQLADGRQGLVLLTATSTASSMCAFTGQHAYPA